MIQEICLERGVPYTYAESLFYGRYPYSLSIIVPFSSVPPFKGSRDELLYQTWLKKRVGFQKRRDAYAAKALSVVNNCVDHQVHDRSISVYFTEEADLVENVKRLAADFTLRVKAPKSADLIEEMRLNPNRRYRRGLWLSRFRFKVEIKHDFTQFAEAQIGINDLLSDNPVEESAILSYRGVTIDDSRALYRGGREIYLSEETDVTLLHLAIPGFVGRVLEAVPC